MGHPMTPHKKSGDHESVGRGALRKSENVNGAGWRRRWVDMCPSLLCFDFDRMSVRWVAGESDKSDRAIG